MTPPARELLFKDAAAVDAALRRSLSSWDKIPVRGRWLITSHPKSGTHVLRNILMHFNSSAVHQHMLFFDTFRSAFDGGEGASRIFSGHLPYSLFADAMADGCDIRPILLLRHPCTIAMALARAFYDVNTTRPDHLVLRKSDSFEAIVVKVVSGYACAGLRFAPLASSLSHFAVEWLDKTPDIIRFETLMEHLRGADDAAVAFLDPLFTAIFENVPADTARRIRAGAAPGISATYSGTQEWAQEPWPAERVYALLPPAIGDPLRDLAATLGYEPARKLPAPAPPPAEPDELTEANEVFRRRFPHAAGALPFYYGAGRGLLPPQWTRPALIVPLDGHYVVEDPVVNRPVSWLSRAFSRDLPRLRQTLEAVGPALDAASFPDRDIDGVTPFFPNAFFGPMDAAALTGMIGLLRPRRYVEIGSGISTRFARRAIQQCGLATTILCIDPSPRSSITAIADEVVPQSVLAVDTAIFETLGENDILFFDGSHLSFSGTDCAHFFLEILPWLAAGVHVHLHDIFLPNDYPARLRTRFYNEQQLLAAFLAGNSDFAVVLPINYLHELGYCAEGVSFWLKRVRSTT